MPVASCDQDTISSDLENDVIDESLGSKNSLLEGFVDSSKSGRKMSMGEVIKKCFGVEYSSNQKCHARAIIFQEKLAHK